MKRLLLAAECVSVVAFFSVWAEPGGTYTLTGDEKGVEEIIKADMARYPELYKGVNFRSYLSDFKRKNEIGKRKFTPGDTLHFPDTAASLSAKKAPPAVQEEQPAEPGELPLNFKLRDLPDVIQEGSYCVPASGAWIAKFHGIETDQWQIAKLSSQGSMDNAGTNPLDMAHAMENFGFQYREIENKHIPGDVDGFIAKTLPLFKEALVREGPMYISFLPGIFGDQGHGCVVIGYSDTRNEMYFYNPWGREYSAPYREVEKYTRSVIAFTPPGRLDDEVVDCTALIESLKQLVPNNVKNVIELREILEASGISFDLTECNRSDLLSDAKKTERLARRESQKFIDLAVERVSAIIIPQTDEEGVTDYLFIRKSPESEKKLLVQRIGANGWEEPELTSSRLLVRYWTTPVDVNGRKQWQLPLFEFSGASSVQPEY
jgi:hypothetical protein